MADFSGKLQEIIYPLLVFREEAAFSIPKRIREIGYIQSLDIQISSINWNLYENGKALPPIQFYGYVQLVMQDACTIEIPIHFPRQRIWSYRVESALSQWRDIHIWINGEKQWFEFFFNLLNAGQDPPIAKPPFKYPDTNFVESPLREVFIRCPKGTQFEIEITQWEPVSFSLPDGDTYDGKSRQKDGDKDGGLPSKGIQPRKNPIDDPWKGNRPESFLNLDNGFFAPIDNLFDPVDEYEPPQPQFEGGQCEGIEYRISVSGRTNNNFGDLRFHSTIGDFAGAITEVIPEVLSDGTARYRVRRKSLPDGFIFIRNDGAGIGTTLQLDDLLISRKDGLADDCGDYQPDDPAQI